MTLACCFKYDAMNKNCYYYNWTVVVMVTGGHALTNGRVMPECVMVTV